MRVCRGFSTREQAWVLIRPLRVTWSREKEVTSQGVMEVYSLRAEAHVAPSLGVPGYREEVIVQGKKFERLQGLFTTPYEPFIPENDPLSSELLHLATLNSCARKA